MYTYYSLIVKMAHLRLFTSNTIILSEKQKDEERTSTTIILPYLYKYK